jgi:hypothetical protein
LRIFQRLLEVNQGETRNDSFSKSPFRQVSQSLGSSTAKLKLDSTLEERGKIILQSFRNLGVLECVYRYLLGEKIRYRMGVDGPYFDLFLLCVLMNQRWLAFELWKQCLFPDHCAILGVCLLHKWHYVSPQHART